jgi:hypothetical protein
MYDGWEGVDGPEEIDRASRGAYRASVQGIKSPLIRC